LGQQMKLFKYQQEIFDKVKDNDIAALYMEPGTGKTIVSLKLHEYSRNKKLLVLCLASKVNEWVEDCSMISNNVIPLNQGEQKNKKILKERIDVYIVSFQSALRIKKELLKLVDNETTIIIDESQFIKNHTSQISRLTHKLGQKAGRRYILTGTPQNKGYIDYFSQFKFLGVFEKIGDFKEKFCVEEIRQFGPNIKFKEVVGYKNTDILDKIINTVSVFFKRDRDDNEIPKERFIYFPKSEIYDEFKKDKVYKDSLCVNNGVLRMRLRQLCNGFIENYHIDYNSKYDRMIDLVKYYDKRIVIFVNYTKEAEMIYEKLKDIKPISIYTGQIKDIENFKNEENSVIITNYGSGGTGINWLSIAAVAIFFSPPESYLQFEQARKRLDRIGQKNNVYIYKYCTERSVEEAIYKSLEQKQDFDDRKFEEYLQK